MKIAGTILIAVALVVLVAIFWPVAKEEIKYNYNQAVGNKFIIADEQTVTPAKVLTPPNTDFSIIIPKIDAVAPVVANVDSQNKTEYLKALKRGVAQAKGTALPGSKGNVYIFAHSTDAFYNVNTYNAVFYLLGKLTKGDEVFIYYQGTKYKYLVDQVKVVAPNDSQYLTGNPDKNTLTMQTCYPPGTTLDRLIVIANQVY